MLQLPALHIIIILVHLYGHAIQINGSQTMIIIIKKKKEKVKRQAVEEICRTQVLTQIT